MLSDIRLLSAHVDTVLATSFNWVLREVTEGPRTRIVVPLCSADWRHWEVEVYSGKVEAWNQLRFWIVVGLQYSRLPVTPTLYNSNLPLFRSNFHSLQNIFYTILPSITRTFFYFPWTFELSGVDCTCKFVLHFFWLIETKWSKFTILSHRWISRLRLELMHCTSYTNLLFETWTGRQILKHWCHAIAQMLLSIESVKHTSLIRRYKMKVWLSEMEKGRSRCIIRSVNENQKSKGNEA